MRSYDITVAGHTCLDIYPVFERNSSTATSITIQPGRSYFVGPIYMGTGGAVPNVGVSLIKLGQKVYLMGKIGDDRLGSTLVDILSEYTNETAHMVTDGASTSYTVVVAPPQTDRSFLHHPGCNDTFSLEDIDLDIVDQSKIFHFGYPTLMKSLYKNNGSELIKILKAVKAKGVIVSLDLSMPDSLSDARNLDWRRILAKALPYVDIFLPSIEESLLTMKPEVFKKFDTMSPDRQKAETPVLAEMLSKDFLDFGVKISCIKCGESGCYMRTAGRDDISALTHALMLDPCGWTSREIWCQAYKCPDVATTTGAGDAAIAGFLTAVLSGMTPEQTLSCACATGMQSLSGIDAATGIKTWEDTIEFISSENERHEILLGPDWYFNNDAKVWLGRHDASV